MNEEIKKEAQDVELNLEELGEVAGGYIFGRGDDRNRPWEVINLDGSVVERFATKEEAINLANIIGLAGRYKPPERDAETLPLRAAFYIE